jgi:putative ABC transport system ATP-binding protein
VSAVETAGLSRTFGEGARAVTAVDDVTLQVAAGEVVLLLGPSGSGKTTLVSMLGGLLRPSRGSVRIAGRDLRGEGLPPRMRLRTIGFVFQTFNLLAAMTARENVALPLRLLGVPGAAARRRATDLLEALGMGGRLDARLGTLSGGEKQRVSLARALIADPVVLLADEPTASLDTRTGREAMTLLCGRAREGRQACVVVTHDTRLTDFADRVLYIQDGRISATPPDAAATSASAASRS